jgi:hypothetical protein
VDTSDRLTFMRFVTQVLAMTSSAASAAEAAVASSRTTGKTELEEAEVNFRGSDLTSPMPVRLRLSYILHLGGRDRDSRDDRNGRDRDSSRRDDRGRYVTPSPDLSQISHLIFTEM